MKELAQALKQRAGLRMRQGVVTAVDGATCTVLIGGSTVPVDGVQHLNSCAPDVDDVVWITSDGADLWIIGTHGDPPPIDLSRLPAFETYFVDGDPDGPPADVTGLTGAALFGMVVLSWDLPPEALWRTWEVFEGTTAGFAPDTPILVADSTVVQINRDTGSGPWYYKVRAINSRGEASADVEVGPFTLPMLETVDLGPGSVHAATMAAGAVDLESATVVGAHLAAKLADNAVTLAKLDTLVTVAIDTAQSTADAAAIAAAAAQATADGIIVTYYQTDAPTGLNDTSDLGALWFDTDDNQAYRWAGSVNGGWILIIDNSVAAALAAAQSAQATADGKITAFYQTGAPTTLMEAGDLWFDTDDKNKPYYYSGSAWSAVRDGTIADAQAQAVTATNNAATADGKAVTAQAAAAAAAAAAATAGSDAAAADAAAATAQSTADAASTAADAADAAAAAAAGLAATKAVVLYQTSAPGSTYQNAETLWIDTTDSANTPKRWTGSAWSAVTDKAATNAASAAATADAKAVTAQASAATAAAAAATADGKAVTAQGAASAAAASASAASTAASVADGKAVTAQADADAAATAAAVADAKAVTAQAAATTADAKAVTAQTTANGKNTVIFSTSAASGTAFVAGDVWFQKSGALIIGQWEFVSGAWAARTIANAVIANLDAGKITSGSIDAARIAAGTITAVMIAADTIVAGNIAAGAIGASELAANSVIAGKIAAGIITATEINTASLQTVLVTATAVNALALSAGSITAGTLDAARIAAGSIAASKLNVSDVQASVVTAAVVNALALNASSITTGSLAAARLTAGSITSTYLNVANVQAAVVTAAVVNALTLNAVNITGGTITGPVIRTKPSGKRVELNGTDYDRLSFYTGVGGEVYPANILIDAGAQGLFLTSPGFAYGWATLGLISGTASVPPHFTFSHDVEVQANLAVTGKTYPLTDFGTQLSDDGIWVQDRYASNPGGRYKLAYNSSTKRLSISNASTNVTVLMA